MDVLWLVPIFSLIGGAGGAAIINGAFGIKKLKADRVDEHQRWLRDQRQVAYVAVLDSTRHVYEWLTFKGLGTQENRDELLLHLGKVDMAMVRLLGPKDISDAADALYRSLQDMMVAKMAPIAVAQAAPVDLAIGIPSEEEALNRYGAAKKELLRLCREDLGREP